MPTHTIEVDIDFDFDKFDDAELIEELVSRGFMVLDEHEGRTFETAVAALRQGNKAEAFILLERAIPELKGLLT